MQRTLSSEAATQLGKKVLVKGWLHIFRDLGHIAFVVVRDRGGLLQVVVDDKKQIKELNNLQPGSVLTIEGTVSKTKATELGLSLLTLRLL